MTIKTHLSEDGKFVTSKHPDNHSQTIPNNVTYKHPDNHSQTIKSTYDFHCIEGCSALLKPAARRGEDAPHEFVDAPAQWLGHAVVFVGSATLSLPVVAVVLGTWLSY